MQTMPENDQWEKLDTILDEAIVSCYFALTTISNVGYGDFKGITKTERIYLIIFMIFGVAFFSVIMDSFINIITS